MIAVGDRDPPNIFRELGPVGPETVSSDTLFAGRRGVLFSCPGAFTPKSSEQHVPSYLALANEILAEGIDEYCAYLSTIPS